MVVMWLEDYFPIGKLTFQGVMLNFGGVSTMHESMYFPIEHGEIPASHVSEFSGVV